MGLIVDSTCVPFESISSHPNTSGQSHQVGWIKVISCVETANHNISTFTTHRNDYLSLSTRAISIKFQPPGGTDNPNYANLTVIAKPYSNPIQYGLNYNKELSYTYNAMGNVSGYASTSNWIGTPTALARLEGYCYGGPALDNGYPDDFHERIYHACHNLNGIHIIPNRDGTVIYLCSWDYSQLLGDNIEIYFGFVPEDCVTESPTKTPTNQPSNYPTEYPTTSPSNNPSINPTLPPTFPLSNNPTLQLSEGEVKSTSTDIPHATNGNMGGTSNSDNTNIYKVMAILTWIICIFVIIVILVLVWFRKQKAKRSQKDMDINIAESKEVKMAEQEKIAKHKVIAPTCANTGIAIAPNLNMCAPQSHHNTQININSDASKIPVNIPHEIIEDIHLGHDEQRPEGVGAIAFSNEEQGKHSSSNSSLFSIPGTAPDKDANQINSHQTHTSNYIAKNNNSLARVSTTTRGSAVTVSNNDTTAGHIGDV